MRRYLPAAPYFYSTGQRILNKSVVKPGSRQKIYQNFSSELLVIPFKRIIVLYSIIYVHAARTDKSVCGFTPRC